jgi:hypothetical protein
VAALALGVLAACGAADERPVAALATVTLDRVRLPFGSPLETRFVFERSDEPVVLEGPYRVFVHYTDLDGVLLWSDDHDPPTPVDAWRPGEPVSWRRRPWPPAIRPAAARSSSSRRPISPSSRADSRPSPMSSRAWTSFGRSR